MKTRTPKLRPAQLAALRQYRENFQGLDPDMSRVTSATLMALVKHRLVAVVYTDQEDSDELVWDGRAGERVFERAMIPTRAGFDLLERIDRDCPACACGVTPHFAHRPGESP